MQLHGESVKVADVKWAEVAVESVVEQRLVDAEVDRRIRLGSCGGGTGLSSRRPL